MPAVVLDHDGVAALAFNQGRDVGVAQVTLEDQQVAFPVTELRTITNEIRTLRYPAGSRKGAVAGFPRAAGAAFAAAFRQMLMEFQRLIFLAIDEAIDRLGADPHGAHAIGEQTTGNLCRATCTIDPLAT